MDESPLLVAVIDDDASIRKALKRLLQAMNLDAETFASGQDFLDSLAAQCPDCIVLDLQMPGMSGLDLLRHLARRDLHLPFVVLTETEEPETRAQCLSAGATAYFTKPVDDEALLAAIQGVAGAVR